jgi:hypothetical protein
MIKRRFRNKIKRNFRSGKEEILGTEKRILKR